MTKYKKKLYRITLGKKYSLLFASGMLSYWILPSLCERALPCCHYIVTGLILLNLQWSTPLHNFLFKYVTTKSPQIMILVLDFKSGRQSERSHFAGPSIQPRLLKVLPESEAVVAVVVLGFINVITMRHVVKSQKCMPHLNYGHQNRTIIFERTCIL